jgi:hypothetical protein
MKWSKWLEKWDMSGLKIKAPFLEMEWHPQEADRNAAWELYAELLTRITPQTVNPECGDEETALESIYSIFPLTRDIIRRHGSKCFEFTKIAVLVLNQVIRPFTSKWHKLQLAGAFKNMVNCKNFRDELAVLQPKLRNYTKMLSDMAGVEDLTELEEY